MTPLRGFYVDNIIFMVVEYVLKVSNKNTYKDGAKSNKTIPPIS